MTNVINNLVGEANESSIVVGGVSLNVLLIQVQWSQQFLIHFIEIICNQIIPLCPWTICFLWRLVMVIYFNILDILK